MDRSAPKPLEARAGRRGKAYWITAVGGVALLLAVLLAGGTVAAARAESAYRVARFCSLPVSWDADCVQQVPGTVTGVTDTNGKGAQHILDVSTPDGDHSVRFPGGNVIVGSILDGAPVTLTVWRGIVVSVTAMGTAATTSSDPAHHLHSLLGGTLALLGVAMLLMPARGLARLGDSKRPPLSASATFSVFGSFLAGFVMLLGGAVSGGGGEPAPTFLAVVLFLVPALAFAAWLTQRSVRLHRAPTRNSAGFHAAHETPASVRASAAARRTVRTASQRSVPAAVVAATPRRMRRPSRATVLYFAFLLLGLGTATTFITAVAECVPGRAHDHAPFCPDGVVAQSCRADTTLQVNGTRTSGAMTVLFAASDGTTYTASFDETGDLRAEMASAVRQRTPIPVELWHGKVWRADFDGVWALAGDRPIYEVPATAALAIFSGSVVILCRLVLRGRSGARGVDATLHRVEGVGQALLLAGGIWWLETGSPWGAAAVVADAAWVAGSFVATSPGKRGRKGHRGPAGR